MFVVVVVFRSLGILVESDFTIAVLMAINLCNACNLIDKILLSVTGIHTYILTRWSNSSDHQQKTVKVPKINLKSAGNRSFHFQAAPKSGTLFL